MSVLAVQTVAQPASGFDALDVFEISERVVAHGAYARFSSLEQLAVCLWISERRPQGDRCHQVTIVARPDPTLEAEVQARRMNRAYAAAEAILDGGVAPIPDALGVAISAVLKADAEYLATRTTKGNSPSVLSSRDRLVAAIDVLRATFPKEATDGQH